MAYSEEEKELVEALRNNFIIQKILTFTLTREEYSYYAAELAKGRNALKALTTYIKSYYQSFIPPLPLDDIQTSAEAFYTVVDERDNALTNNIIASLEAYNTPIAQLIIGGFHTDGITQRLKEKQISFFVASPKVDTLDTDGINTYYDVMEKFWLGDQSAE